MLYEPHHTFLYKGWYRVPGKSQAASRMRKVASTYSLPAHLPCEDNCQENVSYQICR